MTQYKVGDTVRIRNDLAVVRYASDGSIIPRGKGLNAVEGMLIYRGEVHTVTSVYNINDDHFFLDGIDIYRWNDGMVEPYIEITADIPYDTNEINTLLKAGASILDMFSQEGA